MNIKRNRNCRFCFVETGRSIGLQLPDDRPRCNYSSLKEIEQEWLEG